MKEAILAAQRILFVDDESTAREVARHNLRQAGFEVDVAESAEHALKLFDKESHPLVITDLRLPGMDGLKLMERIHERNAETSVVVITAFGDVETAVMAMRRGAYDFIPKPFNRQQLNLTVARAMERAALLAENRRLAQEVGGIERPILYKTDVMNRCLNMADRVARTNSTVLLTGESGTGKELIARRIHARSPRADHAFIPINCAAIPAELMESEFFGHEAGAFTGAQRKRKGKFQQAHLGTLFLDEVAELPLSLQGKLLRVLQEGQVDPVGGDHPLDVDVRLIAATNQDLQEKVAKGAFRQDLYYRLNVVEIRLPSLRERPVDIPLLARHFVTVAAKDRTLAIPKDVLQALERYDWPGNVRELQNACERLAVLCPEDSLRLEDLPPSMLLTSSLPLSSMDDWLDKRPPGMTLFDLERLVIEHTLKKQRGNLSASARELGVPRHILAYRVEKFGIRVPASGE